MEMIWDHSVTQENCGSKLPIVIPYQQLIHTLLYLLYEIIYGIVQLQRKTVYCGVKKAKKGLKKTSLCLSTISEQYIQIQWGYF